ncbi:carbohydrate-binding protein [Streptomyces lunaelactis]|uniref:carbohydrate-binding protein n=1 Tax=Streptomyces lunaelactis TaxID=1535768 RepID=UPI0015854916|nr:carbohydrate-binding protein [Streptomyces lunaelactis]NUK10209.1 carbohydrate-binding protein [Streptomyces lunaelactis]NUK36545.1 carbohydrate-binding protein [Streptomyces lunaelactis]NUK42741.1 carbohydrate-binding protein [Streptomyces lunaelactis]NUK59594.1 carbohydrate-binding protein [Streptomyces lunaelactis]NUK93750.1 carbohydrate-binding protein [Streptomyces lunaelactis]
MVRSLLAHHLHQRLSDAEIGQLVRQGRAAAFQTVVVRHWPAVAAYLTTCFKDRAAVSRGTEQVLSDLYDATVGGDPPAGSIRVHLLTTARTLALREWRRAPEAWDMADEFRNWAAAGGTWPLSVNSGITEAYHLLRGRSQAFLWHAVVERDPKAYVARVLGMKKHEFGAFAELSHTALREAYRALQGNAPAAGITERALSREARPDLSDLDGQLRAQLPVILLGWWEGTRYEEVRAATTPPAGFPPFLARAVRAASRVPRVRRRNNLLRCFAGPRLGLAAGGAAATGVVPALSNLSASHDDAALYAPAPSPSTAPAASQAGHVSPRLVTATDVIRAADYTAESGTLAAEGTVRTLTDGSLLRFDTVDFGDDARIGITLGLMSQGPPGAEIAVRLDRPDAPVAATIPAPEAGPARWVHAPLRPTAGVHTVYLTACCAAGNSCVSITAITFS